MADLEGDVVDLTGEDSILDPGSRGRRAQMSPALAPLPHRAGRLVVVRESNESDYVLFQGMVQQTSSYLDDPRVAQVMRDVNIRPLTQPQSVPELAPTELRLGRAKATLFIAEGTYFLYAMTSAARRSERGDVDWAHLLNGVIEALRPRVVVVAALSRLVRSMVGSAQIMANFTKHVDRVIAGQTPLDMKGQAAQQGQLMWSVMTLIAASERDSIVQRLTAGTVCKYLRGEWVKGVGAVPLGYTYDTKSKTLVVDPLQRDAVAAAWTLLADPSATDQSVIDSLHVMGISTPTMRRRHGDSATVSSLTTPTTYVNGLFRWQGLYLTGRHTTLWSNPFEGALHVAGLPVHRGAGQDPETSTGYLHFDYDFGRPNVDPAVIHEAIRIRAARPSHGGGPRKSQPGLSQMGWLQSGFEHWLVAGTGGTYEIRIRPIGEC